MSGTAVGCPGEGIRRRFQPPHDIDIPEREFKDAIKFTRARTKREAVSGAIMDFNRRMRMAELANYAGTCADLIAPEELQTLRRRDRAVGLD